MSENSKTIVSVAALIRDSSGRVLLAAPSNLGPWSLIGGGVADSETKSSALIRHAENDAGLEIELKQEVARLVGDKYRVLYECGADQTWIASVYEVEIKNEKKGSPLITSWFDLSQLSEIYLDEFAKSAFEDLNLE